jgi:hypothetical protein
LTQVISDTPGGTLASGEIITTFYEFAQLDNGEPNTPGSSNTLSNSIPCVSNYPFIMGNQLTNKERDQVTDLLIKYENVFAFSMKDLGRCKTMQFSIDFIDETPIYQRKHRLNKHEWELVDERCKELHEVGLIQPSSSNFRAVIVMPTKNYSTGLWTKKRMCTLLEIWHFATPLCNWFPVACDTCNWKFAQLRTTSCMKFAIACDSCIIQVYTVGLYGFIHPYFILAVGRATACNYRGYVHTALHVN